MGSVGITTDGYLKPKTTIYGHGGTQSYTEQEVAELSGRKVYQHFHSPANDHNRFMSSRDPREKAIIRDTARPAPYTVQPNPWEPGALRTAPFAPSCMLYWITSNAICFMRCILLPHVALHVPLHRWRHTPHMCILNVQLVRL